jgi:hypothetical protein
LEQEAKMQGRIEMSAREVNRLEVVIQVAGGLASQRKAGEWPGFSERQVRRLLRGDEILPFKVFDPCNAFPLSQTIRP